MDKQKQIEEMAKEIAKTLFDDCLLNNGGHCEDCECNREETKEYDCQSYLVAKKILEKYQPKIPEGAVVLTREEYDGKSIIVEMSGGHKLKLSVGKFGKMSKILEEHTRKETAEKFAERLKALVADRNCNEDYEWEDVQVDGQIFIECVDEICKEFTEGK